MFGPEFRRDSNMQTGDQSVLDHLPVYAFGVEINFDAAAAAGDTFENAFLKIVAAFGDAALAVNAKRDAVDGRHSLEQGRQSVATVGRVIVRI